MYLYMLQFNISLTYLLHISDPCITIYLLVDAIYIGQMKGKLKTNFNAGFNRSMYK